MRRRDEAESPFAFLLDFRHIGPYLRPHKGLAVVSLILMAASAGMALLSPWPLALLLDTVLGNKPPPALLGFLDGLSTYQLLAVAVIAGLVVTALEHGLAVYDNYVNTKLDQSMVLDLRSDMFRHAQKLSMAYHDSKQMGKLMFQINTQAAAVGAVTVSIPPLLQSVLTLVGMFVVIEQIQPTLALLSLTVVPFVYLSAGYYTRHIEPRVYSVRKLEGDSLTIVHEAMSMLRVIVAFGRERHEYGKFRAQGEQAVAARVNLTVRQTVFTLAVTMITAVGTALVLGFGARHVLQKDMTVGELVVVMGYIASMYKPLEQISTTFSSLQQAFISLRSAFELLETEPEIVERPGALALRQVRGAIAFEHVDFAYGGRQGTLKDVSFRVEPGQCVAIVGPTGAGKSTLLSLLTRFYDPARGRVTLDGHDVRDLRLNELRSRISVVLQEPLLFGASIRENIRYGRLEASDEEVEAAARAANAHAFVSALPKGYDTKLGERGALLSGGERQRISVARAFLKDAPVLILDEPTSSIDSKTEAVILDALARLIRGRTTFVVAHRLSTIRDADLILAVDDGRVVEQGTHAELLAHDGLYAELHAAQQGAPLPQQPVTLQPEAIAELQQLAMRRIRKDDPLEPAIRTARSVLGELGLWETDEPRLSIVAGGER
ncbi:MAG: ABC transporter ATP-binding protein [Actinobacteria bacterium]|nr:ABC transporter ATP-binding protein [Actinomycetota bacterium]